MERLIVIKYLHQLQELEDYINRNEYIAFDTETTGIEKDSKIIGFSVSADTETGYYVVLSYWDVETKSLINTEVQPFGREIISMLVGKQLIMHNCVFDCWMVGTNFQIELIKYVHTDTMILGHVLNENRHNGLKELGVSIFGEDAKKEQMEMKESVHRNGGTLTKTAFELYKADAELLGKYGAKDAVLTIKLFYVFVEQLYAQKLDKFFYEEESMPLLRSTTYELNCAGLRVHTRKLQELKIALESECLEQKAFIYKEIDKHIKDDYPGTNKSNTFNISSGQQLSWLLFHKLQNDFNLLTKGGKELCKELDYKVPYIPSAKRDFIKMCVENKGRAYGKAKKIGNYWKYLSTDKETLPKYATKYKWVNTLIAYNKNMKLLSVYVEGIQERIRYGIIRPSFLQHGTTSGRYSSKNPNFQNLPRDDKRIKACIIPRSGKVFVGADYSQLEPRVFASVSQDLTLMSCFEKGEDFYSVVGIPIFEKFECSPFKKDPNSFAEKYPELRNISKAFALATPYGTSASQQSQKLNRPREECQNIINRYFQSYPNVELMMLKAHEQAKDHGIVHSLYGRPRRIPEATEIRKIYGKNTEHGDLPYSVRTLLNLSMNHTVQSSAASIMNRASIAFYNKIRDLNIKDCIIVLQIHDEMVIECLEKDAQKVSNILKECMENTTILPGVKLVAEPVIAKSLADLK